MRHRCLSVVTVGAVIAALGLFPTTALGGGACCGPGPVIVYGAAPAPLAYPPTGYVLNPADARAPIYIVNQGPVYSGLGFYTVPTYSEGGYAFSPYPYVSAAGYGYPRGYAPFVRPSFRPYGAPPVGAYYYRPSPSARVIDVRRRHVHTPPRARPPRREHYRRPPAVVPPRTVPPPTRPEPGKPVEEQWTRGSVR